MLLADLVATSRRVTSTRRRLEKIEALAGLLRRATPDEVPVLVPWLAGELRQGRIGIGPSAVRQAARVEPSAAGGLDVAAVDATFERILAASGAGSTAARVGLLRSLMERALPDEADFLARLLAGELRQGALEGVMVEALARAYDAPAAGVRRALMHAGSLVEVASALATRGAAGLGAFRLQLFRPLQPMLASPARDLDDALALAGEAALEWKLDGARVQVHALDGDVRAYSRGLHDVTAAVPELVEAVRALPVRSAVLDGELIALRPDGTPHAFQDTMRRFGRRSDVESLRDELPLTPFFFDALHVDGDDLLDRPALERFAALADLARERTVPRVLRPTANQAAAFLDDAMARGHEGVMAKALDSRYEAGSRGAAWLKVKPVHVLDLVVIAVEPGSGRRQGWLSNLHLGARDPSTGGYAMVGKTFKGMTDAMLAWQTERLRALALGTDGHVVAVRPELVVEVAFGDVQASPRYEAGCALRFARVKRYREDKRPEEADTIETVRGILESRAGAE